jgi:hypothetical protein
VFLSYFILCLAQKSDYVVRNLCTLPHISAQELLSVRSSSVHPCFPQKINRIQAHTSSICVGWHPVAVSATRIYFIRSAFPGQKFKPNLC